MTRSLRDFLARYPGVAANRLLLEAGIDPDTLGDHEATHSVRSLLTFLESAARATGDESFGLQWGAQIPMQDLDVLGYVMLHSPTLGAGLDNACRYYGVQQTLGRASLERGWKEARLTYAIAVPRGVPTAQLIDGIFAVLVKYCREVTRKRRWSPREVQFVHGAPSDKSWFQRWFGAPVSFDEKENAIVFRPADLALPVHEPDARLLPVLERHARDLLRNIPQAGRLADKVRRQIAETLRTGNVSIEAVAAGLTTTPRAIQRGLREAGSSYQQVLGETRLACAERYLADPMLSLTEIAFLLGYSELSAFSRAFRRWTGRSPLGFRRRHR